MMDWIEIIDWEQFGVPQLPVLLKQIISGKHSIHDHPFLTLQEIIFAYRHEEDIIRGYGLSVILKNDLHIYLVPCLIRLLEIEEIAGKYNIVDWLRDIARFVTFHDGKAVHRRRARHIHEIVWGGAAIYLDLLYRKDDEVSTSVILLLCNFPEHLSLTIPIIFNRIKQAQNNALRSRLILSFHNEAFKQGYLKKKHLKEFIRLLTEYVQPAYEYPLRVAAATCLTDIEENKAPEFVIDLVIKAYAEYGISEKHDRLMPPYATLNQIITKL